MVGVIYCSIQDDICKLLVLGYLSCYLKGRTWPRDLNIRKGRHGVGEQGSNWVRSNWDINKRWCRRVAVSHSCCHWVVKFAGWSKFTLPVLHVKAAWLHTLWKFYILVRVDKSEKLIIICSVKILITLSTFLHIFAQKEHNFCILYLEK